MDSTIKGVNRRQDVAAPGRSWSLGPAGRSAAALVLLLLLVVPGLGMAQGIPVRLADRSPDAAYSVWLTTTLDLTAVDQPAARVDLPAEGTDFLVEWEPRGQDYWIFLHERFQPRGGPPVDLMLPASLMPFQGVPAEPVVLSSVDPTRLMTRQRVSFSSSVLTRLLLACLLVFGGGFGVRWVLRGRAARPGHRCAPLEGVGSEPERTRRETQVLAALSVLLLALRMPGFFTDSLDLLEVSYLPGIGRPAPFADGATGIYLVLGMLRELGALYCLDLTHPPLYHAAMGVMGLFGSSEALLRLPALIASGATAWLVWRLLRRWSVAAGLTGFGLVAVAAPAIYFGQDATPYAFVGLVAVGILFVLLRALETGLRRWWTAFFGLLVAGFLSHYNVAPFGLAACLALVFQAWRGRADPRWGATVRLAMGEGLKLAVLPLGWAWLHFSTFPTVAQDTRLVADTYMPDPGALSFLLDFTKVNAGIRADGPTWALLGALPLVALGIWRCLRRSERADRRLLGELAAVLAVVFVASTLFFYDNARSHLGGRIFYGFRWVGWYHPVMLATAGLGLTCAAVPRPVRLALALLWLAGAGPSTVRHLSEPARPDYDGVAKLILEELEDADALATLPAWFERGNLAYYLFENGDVQRMPGDGEGAWTVGGRRLTMEAVHAGLPFETTARSGHYERLWVANVDEQMFGRDKFNAAVAEQALAWADEHLVPDGAWSFDRLELKRYRRPPEALMLRRGDQLHLSAADVVLMARTYPPLEGALVLEPPSALPTRAPSGGASTSASGGGLGRALAYHAPMSPSCVDYEYVRLAEELMPEAANHWFLDLRIPLNPGRPLPTVRAESPAQVFAREDAGYLRVTAVGQPCAEPPLVLEITQD